MQPRIIRSKDAHKYLGMNKSLFYAEVRPKLTAVRIGVRGVGFDRLELDAFADALFGRSERSKEKLWNAENYRQGSSGEKT